jgi:hypothetical protein
MVVISLQAVLNVSKWELVRLSTNAHVNQGTEPETLYATVEVWVDSLISRDERCGFEYITGRHDIVKSSMR